MAEKYKPTAREYFVNNISELSYKSGVDLVDNKAQLHRDLQTILNAGESELKEIVKKRPEIKSVVDDIVRLRTSNPTMSADVKKELAEDIHWRELSEKPDPPFDLTRLFTIKPAARPVVMQGDTRRLSQHKGLHTPSIEEIMERGNKRRPTEPYFDTNSDRGEMINPLEPYYDLSGDFPRLVDPLKPPPKIGHLG